MYILAGDRKMANKKLTRDWCVKKSARCEKEKCESYYKAGTIREDFVLEVKSKCIDNYLCVTDIL